MKHKYPGKKALSIYFDRFITEASFFSIGLPTEAIVSRKHHTTEVYFICSQANIHFYSKELYCQDVVHYFYYCTF